jgi:hypothetical protein
MLLLTNMGRGSSYTSREQELIDLILSKKSDKVSDVNAMNHARFAVTLQRKMKLPKARNVRFLKSKYKEIVSFIQNTYKRGALPTNFNHLSVICFWFGLEGESKKYQELQKKYEELKKAEYAKQQPTDVQRDNWIGLERLRQRLESHWMKKFSEMEQDNSGFNSASKRIIQYTLTAHLNVIEPPMRSVYTNVKITPRLPKAVDVGHGKPNLLYLPARGLARIFVNTDKVSNKESRQGNLGPANWNLRQDTTELIKRSLKLWKRNYVMFDKIAKSEDYNELIKTSLSFGGRIIGSRLIRSIFISDFYEKNASPTMLDKIALGNKMRHSVDTQELVYRKLKMSGDVIEENSDDDDTEVECPGILVNKQTSSAKRQRRYYEAHKEEIRDRARKQWEQTGLHYRQQRMIALLTAGIQKCRESTLEKLGIKCENGTWIIVKEQGGRAPP